MASQQNQFQAMALSRKINQFRLDVHNCFISCKRHQMPQTQDQNQDNEIALHMMALLKELEIREKELKKLSVDP